MVDRIDKTEKYEYWRVHASVESRKSRDEEGNKQGPQDEKDNFTGLGEKTDWNLLMDKSRLWKRNIQINRDEIAEIHFQKLNLKTDPSLLRLDILLKGGNKISPAFVSVSRATGLKIKNLKPGEAIPFEYLMQKNVLWITTPANPRLFAEEEKRLTGNNKNKPPVINKNLNPSDEELTIKRRTFSGNKLETYLRDPVTKKIRLEYVLVAVLPVVFVLLCIWGIFYLL